MNCLFLKFYICSLILTNVYCLNVCLGLIDKQNVGLSRRANVKNPKLLSLTAIDIATAQAHHQQILSYLGFPGKGFHTLIKGVWFSSYGISQSTPLQGPASRSFLQSMWDPYQIHLLRGLASLLAHRLMSTPFGEQPPHRHIARCLALIPFVTAQAHR